MSDVEFSAEQQALVDKLVGEARTKARDKANSDAAVATTQAAETTELASLAAEQKWQALAEKHEARVHELEAVEGQAQAYTDLISEMLKDKVKSLGETAKAAVDALPGSLSDTDKLAWVSKNEALFSPAGDGVGTPGRKQVVAKPGRFGKDRVPHRI